MFVPFRTAVPLTILLTFLLLAAAACGSSPSGDLVVSAPEFQVMDVSGTTSCLSDTLTISTTVETDLTVIEVKASKDLNCEQLLYNITYDPNLYSYNAVTFSDTLGNPEECINAVFTKTPGIVSVGQVRIGLSDTSISSGIPVSTIFFSNSPAKTANDIDTESLGLKLRGKSGTFQLRCSSQRY